MPTQISFCRGQEAGKNPRNGRSNFEGSKASSEVSDDGKPLQADVAKSRTDPEHFSTKQLPCREIIRAVDQWL